MAEVFACSRAPASPRRHHDLIWERCSPLDAFILAAGRGERLRPLTDRCPKPLLDAGGRPIIEYHLDALARAGFDRVVVNLAWLGAALRARLGDGSRFGVEIRYSEEPAGALETAGGIVHALPLLREETFLLVNGDIVTDVDFSTLPPREGLDVEVIMVDNPAHHPRGDFALEDDRLVRPGDETRTLTYAGIGRYRRALFETLAPGRRPLRPVIEAAIDAGRAGGRHHRGRWLDIGTPERLATAGALAASIHR